MKPILNKIPLEDLHKYKSFLLGKIECEKSFYHFFKSAWHVMEGDNPFYDNWHIKAICDHLQACYERRIKKLIINIPPRQSKTNIVSIAFPAWVWIHDSEEKFICASHISKLSNHTSNQCRELIESNWYQSRWGDSVKLSKNQNQKTIFKNTSGGHRIATSAGANITGFGADCIIIDDPEDAHASEVTRESTHEWLGKALFSRLNNKKTGIIILIQQRVDELDTTDYILSIDVNDEWCHLMIPMEFEKARKCETYINDKLFFSDPRIEERELLNKNFYSTEDARKDKILYGSYNYATQFQQRPAPLEGGILRRAWFQIWKGKHYPKFDYVIQSWDTGYSDKITAAYSACTTWGVFTDDRGIVNIFLLSCWRGRVEFTELRNRAKRMKDNYLDIGNTKLNSMGLFTVNKCIIEEKASGSSLIQELRRAGIPAIGFMPRGDKKARVNEISAYIEAGLVHILDKPYNMEFVDEVIKFPNASSRDYVDTLSQIIAYLRDNNMLTIPTDPKPEVYKSDFEIPYPSYKWR
jgi:predicted phage terminase large subunit-like protein